MLSAARAENSVAAPYPQEQFVSPPGGVFQRMTGVDTVKQ
jgi:hypothetical protein